MSATLAPIRHTLEIPARELQPGDRIVGDGIPLMVDFVSPHPKRKGFMAVSYNFCGICGDRYPAAHELLVVQRLAEGSH